MNEILNITMNEMANASFDCSCGKHHTLDIKQIKMGKGVLPELPDMLKKFQGKKVYMLSDNHTFQAAGERTLKIMQDAGFDVKSVMIDSGDDILIPDEKAVGRMFMELEPETAVIVSVGSGTLNDMAKYMSARTKIPYIIVCTAPSMDGYAADGAPLILQGKKISFVATLPYGILGDTDIMKEAPMHMIHAGFGDVIGKLTALADWQLAKELKGEYMCDTCVTLVQRALEKVTSHAKEIAQRDEEAILYLIEALTLTGVAMGLIGVSRPASGAEHMLSHFWEMDFIARNKFPELHGIKVGIATPIIAEIFDMMKDEIPESAMKLAPSKEYVQKLLADVGAPACPGDVGVEKELFYNSILGGYKVRNRYSVLQLAVEKGKIEEIAKELTKELY
ncbi:MAG: sn-glycerol-1-phosphate dehydrogenase [Anaerostipes sp.]|nr:sn-glycerol-1-phosphate dehydrogenase [Anaerostipes sp.]MDD3745125.1 sn-glycerol-1-phosphate dehydrogenase [Anaerostipes sp.]